MYVAHKRETDGAIQTVDEHSQGVMGFAKNYSSELHVSNILQVAALLHDLGKMNKDFNDYINGDSKYKRGDIDHSYAGAKYLVEFAEDMNVDNVKETALFIARIIISHHGLHDWVDKSYRDYFDYRVSKTERYSEIAAAANELVKEYDLEGMLRAAANEYGEIRNRIYKICNKNREEFTFYMGMFERLAESVLIDADRTDTAMFMDNIKPAEFNTNMVWENMCAKIEKMCDGFSKETDHISEQRMSISNRCAAFAESERKICRLIVPTGGGKTISSTRFSARYCKKFNKKKLFYIAPFMSILEQNGGVLRNIAGDAVLEHHSNVIAEIDDDDELNDYERKCERWDEPVIATTAVQFLNTLFSGKLSSVRRFHRLSNSVIIIDEIQSLPIKCVYIFNLAVNFLSYICGSVVVLCSATQPSLEKVKHPLLLDKESSMTGDYAEDFEKFKRTNIIVDARSLYTYEQAAGFAFDKYLENGNLLMIMNTKKAAAELFSLLKERCSDDVEVVHLSTSMCPAHRKDKLKHITGLLKANKPVICITTQLIEAGVDISFNCVIRSAAGAESIAQAAGRCNRHGKDKIRPVYVINIKDEKLGSLEQIKRGKSVFTNIAAIYGDDLESTEAMSAYFEKLYSEYKVNNGKDWLSYPVEDMSSDSSIFNLLSLNSNRTGHFSYLVGRSQAFATAGQLFEVIDQNTRDIIVPYNEEAEKIILDLNSDISAEKAIELLRKAQKYTIGVHSSVLSKMLEEHQVCQLNFGEVLALNKSSFDSDVGIKNKNFFFELLNY